MRQAGSGLCLVAHWMHKRRLRRLKTYYSEFGVDVPSTPPVGGRAPFDELKCEVIEEYRPMVVSFHFGLPEPMLLNRVKAAGSVVLSSATTVAEAC